MNHNYKKSSGNIAQSLISLITLKSNVLNQCLKRLIVVCFNARIALNTDILKLLVLKSKTHEGTERQFEQ